MCLMKPKTIQKQALLAGFGFIFLLLPVLRRGAADNPFKGGDIIACLIIADAPGDLGDRQIAV